MIGIRPIFFLNFFCVGSAILYKPVLIVSKHKHMNFQLYHTKRIKENFVFLTLVVERYVYSHTARNFYLLFTCLIVPLSFDIYNPSHAKFVYNLLTKIMYFFKNKDEQNAIANETCQVLRIYLHIDFKSSFFSATIKGRLKKQLRTLAHILHSLKLSQFKKKTLY